MRRTALSLAALIFSASASLAQTGAGVANPGGQPAAPFGASGSPPVLSGCGTAPSVVGNSAFGTVSEGTASPTGCTLTWTPPRQFSPVCLLSFRTSGFPVTAVTVVNATTLTWTNAAATLGVYDYVCIGS